MMMIDNQIKQNVFKETEQYSIYISSKIDKMSHS